MTIIAENKKENNKVDNLLKNYFIYFYMPQFNGTEWIDYDLPQPNILKHTERGVFIGWAIDGYFGTQKGLDFLNDIVARFYITFGKIERLPYKPQKQTIDAETHISIEKHKLKEFQGLKSILRPAKVISEKRNADTKKDDVFWAIKFFVDDLIISQGIPTYPQMESFAFANFEYKDASTLKCKCANIFNWYEERDFPKIRYRKYKSSRTEEEIKMLRSDGYKKAREKAAKLKADTNQAKVLGAITQLEHLKKKVTGTNIQKITGQNIKTCRKYLNEWKKENKKDD